MDNETTNRPRLKESPIDYAHKAQSVLSGAWSKTKPNLSGMRATFRRWNPEGLAEPTIDMRQYIWGWIGSPFDLKSESSESSDESDNSTPLLDERDKQSEVVYVDRAAIITALRAAAGENEGNSSFGEAMQRAGIGDLRLMRLLTERPSMRTAALHRVVRLLAAKRQGFAWTSEQTKRFHDFLFGNQDRAQSAANRWASDYFRARGKKAPDDVAASATESPDAAE